VITPPQVWDRNFQLAFWSASIYLPILIYDNPTNPFVGWSYVAVCHTGLQPRGRADPGRSATHTLAPCLGQVLCAAVGALGGVLVALSIKYTDSILKTIATTGN
jgi:UDP-sugar transporter A1/2/3|tara:strand:- start:192 stop:503 length:312 start_codon:yes stop_codon:yes gene_type:complete